MDDQPTWPDLAIELYDRLTGRDAEIQYDFHEMEVHVPSRAGNGADHARWRRSGPGAVADEGRAGVHFPPAGVT